MTQSIIVQSVVLAHSLSHTHLQQEFENLLIYVLVVVASMVTMTMNNIFPNGSKTAVIGLFQKNALKVGRLMYSYNTEFGLGHRLGSKFYVQVRYLYFRVKSNLSLNLDCLRQAGWLGR